MAQLDLKIVPDLVNYWSGKSPHAPALIDPARRLDYSSLHSSVERAAEQLSEAGIRAGDRLPIVGENSISVPVLLLASQAIGAWPAIVNPRLPGNEIERMLARIEPRRLVFATGLSQATRRHADTWGACPLEGWPIEEEVRLGALRDAVAEPRSAHPSDDIAVLIFTSGTTGVPKAVMHSHRNLLNLGAVLSRSRETGPGQQVTGATPLPHIMGLSNLINALWAGASIKLSPRMDVADMAEAIRTGEMTTLSMVPTAFQRLLDHIEEQGLSMAGHQLRYMSSAGATLDPALKERVENLFRQPLINGYGMTECAPVSRSKPDSRGPTGCIGRPDEGVGFRLVDERGRDVGDTEVGELWLSGPTVMQGYYRDPAATAAAFPEPGWFASGDLLRLLPDGQLEIVGRRKEMIIRSGFNVYPAEVEAALNSLPGVAQAAVVGRPADQGNEEVVAFVELLPGSDQTPQSLEGEVRALIAPYKRPTEIRILSSLPLGATGKVRKVDLKKMAETTRSAPVD